MHSSAPLTTAAAYHQHLQIAFREMGDPRIAQGQMQYMKHQFDYFGIKAPVWSAYLKALLRTHGVLRGKELEAFIAMCFAEPQREWQYAAILMTERALKHQSADFITILEMMLTQKAWWDSVDWIATKLIGVHLKKYPALAEMYPPKWIHTDYLWWQRAAILYQLKYKTATNTEQLFGFIRQIAHSKEFFLQKAAGWALREYGKTYPQAVQDFVAHHTLPALTRREALRLLTPPERATHEPIEKTAILPPDDATSRYDNFLAP